MNNIKILVGAPVYEGTRYSIGEFLDTIRNLDYSNYDILLVDNSQTDDFFQELKKEEGINVIKDTLKEKPNLKKVVSSRNKILEYALDNKYDYVLMMDSDVIPPKNIISDLLECQKEIVSGLYHNYFRISGKLKLLPVAWKSITKEQFEEIKRQAKLPPQFKSHLDLRRNLTEEEVASNKVLEVLIPSAGCMLLSRKVLEKVRYGLLEEKEIKGSNTTDEIYFMKQAREMNFKAYCHTKIKCKHLVLGKFQKDVNGNMIHPLHR